MALRIEHVTQRFGKSEALTDVSLHIRDGDCYGLIGHNGAGKTTAIRVALGLLRPTSGRVIVDGFDAAQHPAEARARMAAVVETPGFHGHIAGPANLELLARLAGASRKDARADAARVFGLVGLDDTQKPVRAYSMGMRQRLGVAQALLGHPRYLLLDEPTNGFDPDGVAEMRDLFRRLRDDEGTTLLISSHHLHELSAVCNRVGVIRQGRMVVEEELQTLLASADGRYLLRAGPNAKTSLAKAGIPLVPTKDDALVIDLDDLAPETVLRRLVQDGVNVQSFAPQPFSLEEVYLGTVLEGDDAPQPTAVSLPPRLEPPTERLAPGSGWWRVCRYEWRRWMCRAAIPLMFLVPCVHAALAVWFRARPLAGERAEIEGGTLISTTDVTAFEGVAVALQPGVMWLPFLILGFASQSIAGEFSTGTLRNVLLRPLTRLQIVAGKFFALTSLALLAYVVLVAVSVGAAAIAFDFVDYAELLPNGKRYVPEGYSAAELWPEMRSALFSPLLPLLAYVALGLLAGSFGRRGTTGLILSLGFGLAFEFGRGLLREIGMEGWSPAALVPTPFGDTADTSQIQYFGDYAAGASDVVFEFADTATIAPLAVTVVALVVTVWIFLRRYVP